MQGRSLQTHFTQFICINISLHSPVHPLYFAGIVLQILIKHIGIGCDQNTMDGCIRLLEIDNNYNIVIDNHPVCLC